MANAILIYDNQNFVDNGEKVGVIFMNLPITVYYWEKLKAYGFSDQALSLLQNYLCNRIQRSIINGSFNSGRSIQRRCSVRKGVLENFAKFTRKHLCRSLFLIKLQTACNFIKKETLAKVFSCEFCEISKNTFFTEHPRATASVAGTR